ncbi:threonine--tRNA ligase, partial [Buchnera aphidicola]|nr:threonine--tRNA ligase [Buchnera aphidicola]
VYKMSLVKDNINKNNKIGLYYHEKYIDIDVGMQVFNIKFCKNFKLQNISGVYWKNNHKNKMLQRIYGTAWSNKKDLHQYLNYIIEMDKRDHRKIGKSLKLYHFQSES